MARGAQVEYETLLIWNCRGDLPLFDDAIPESTKHSPEGCTSLLYPAAKSSVAVIAHNEDGTPLLVQMFLLYYGMGQFEAVRESVLWILFKEAYWCAITAFALNTAGYTAEILRGAIEQTPFGETEAAQACGMSKSTMYRRIILPGSFRRALPAYGNEVIFMLHGSALAGVITIVDLFGAAKIVNARYFVPFESFITAGFFYLCCTFCIVWFFKWIEKHWYAHLRPRIS